MVKRYIAFLTPKNYPRIDIVAFNPKNGKQVNIQVKTTEEKSFIFSKFKKTEIETKFKEPYVFVHVSKDRESIRFFIVPGKEVAKLIIQRWEEWKKSARHKKQIAPFEEHAHDLLIEQLEKYENKWENLGLE